MLNEKSIEKYALILMLLIECRKNNKEIDYKKANDKLFEITIKYDDNYNFLLKLIYDKKPTVFELDSMLHEMHKKNSLLRQKAFEYGNKNSYFYLNENFINEFKIDENLVNEKVRKEIEKLINKMNDFLTKKNYDCYVDFKFIFFYNHIEREKGEKNFFAIKLFTVSYNEFEYVSNLLVKKFLKDFQKIVKNLQNNVKINFKDLIK